MSTAVIPTTASITVPTTCWECSTCCGALARVEDGLEQLERYTRP